jgi:peptide-methionine (S)-S-oxide reductase
MTTQISVQKNIPNRVIEIATFAGGCFWCTEAIFLALEGVESVEIGRAHV